MRNPYTISHAKKRISEGKRANSPDRRAKQLRKEERCSHIGACIAKKMIRETLCRGKNALAGKISYRKAQFVIAAATFMAMPQMTFADPPASTETSTSNGQNILNSMINNVFEPLGKIVGGFMVVGGIFKYLMAQKDEDARGQHGAIMAIAVGALLFGASTILSSANVSNLVTG